MMNKPIQRFTRLLFLLTIVSLFGCSTTPPRETPEPDSFNKAIYNKAKAAFLSGDYKTASTIFDTLAENGNAEAQYSMGYMHYYGKGLPRSLKQAMHWFKLAAAQGNENAIEALATIDELLKEHQPGSNLATESLPQEIVVDKKPDKLVDLRTSKPPVTVNTTPVINENLAVKTEIYTPGNDLMPPEQELTYEQAPPLVEPDTTPADTISEQPQITKAIMQPEEVKSTEWILKQPAKHYTIQLASSSDYRNAASFTRRVSLDGVYYFRAMVKGQLRYSVIHGSFSSYSQAKSKQNLLMKRGYKGTWIRGIKDIQEIIKSSQ